MTLRLCQVPGPPAFPGAPGVAALLADCDGRGRHVPYPASREGLAAAAAEIGGAQFPRSEVADLLAAYQEEIGAPRAARDQAHRLRMPGCLAVVAGQQPGVAGGPLLVLYKALTAVALAREAEDLLGVPVVPLFWNASEDHDLAEMSLGAAPGPGGRLQAFRADLSAWEGGPAEAIGPHPVWQEPARAWLDGLAAGVYAPRPSEGWSAWTSRILAEELGPEGLVILEPRLLRPLAGPLFRRALAQAGRVAALLEESGRERPEGARAFPPQEGPLLFLLDQGRRRRILAEGDGFRPKGGGHVQAEVLLAAAAAEPERFSAHGALRPVVQNVLLPVVAQVLGPGELAYHVELLRFHASEFGAGRRMPLLWPRLSATVLDRRGRTAMERLGLSGAELFEPLEALKGLVAGRAGPAGGEEGLAARVRALGAEAAARLEALGPRLLALDPTLAVPVAKTAANLVRPAALLAEKVAAAEARVRGQEPEALERLHAWVHPGGRPQERVFSLAPFLAWWGAGSCRTLLSGLDLRGGRHCMLCAGVEEQGS